MDCRCKKLLKEAPSTFPNDYPIPGPVAALVLASPQVITSEIILLNLTTVVLNLLTVRFSHLPLRFHIRFFQIQA